MCTQVTKRLRECARTDSLGIARPERKSRAARDSMAERGVSAAPVCSASGPYCNLRHFPRRGAQQTLPALPTNVTAKFYRLPLHSRPEAPKLTTVATTVASGSVTCFSTKAAICGYVLRNSYSTTTPHSQPTACWPSLRAQQAPPTNRSGALLEGDPFA
jgi:hypothetical protein